MCEAILQHGYRTKEVHQILTGARNVLGAVQRRQGHWQESMATYQEVLTETERRALAEKFREKCARTPINRRFGHAGSAKLLLKSLPVWVKSLRRVSFSSAC